MKQEKYSRFDIVALSVIMMMAFAAGACFGYVLCLWMN
jgi:hypothetical protein